MCIHELIMGIHNSVMDIPLEGIYSLLASHISMHLSVASQRIHDANNVIREVLLHVKRERVRVTLDSGAQIATRHVRVH